VAFTEKIKKVIRSRAVLFRLIVTILVFICIPLLAVQMFIINESAAEVDKSNQDKYCTLLENIAETFEAREGILSQTAVSGIGINSKIQKPLRSTATDYSLKEAADALENYGKEILHMDAVGIYYISKGLVIIGGYHNNLQDYCEKMEASNPEHAEKLENFLRSIY
jgi:hypothetical protein